MIESVNRALRAPTINIFLERFYALQTRIRILTQLAISQTLLTPLIVRRHEHTDRRALARLLFFVERGARITPVAGLVVRAVVAVPGT